jgi:hypothetical protein
LELLVDISYLQINTLFLERGFRRFYLQLAIGFYYFFRGALWLRLPALAQKPWIVRIPGTTRLLRLEENVGAVDVELTADDFREIEDITSRVEVKGARYSGGSQKLVNR